ncbi:MAG: hypothetical protein ACLQVJ_29680 [Syntrophobacteraceae bacterium]
MTDSEFTTRIEAQGKRLDELGTRLASIREEYLSQEDKSDSWLVDMLNKNAGNVSKPDPDALSAEDEAAVNEMLERSGPKRRMSK